MVKRIEVEAGDARARFILREDLAPKTAGALWETLPIEGSLRQSKLSGDACFVDVPREPLASLPERPELPVTSIYKGWIVVFPAAADGKAELLISYGTAEHRRPTGRRHVAPVAELEGDGAALFDVLRRTHTEGSKQVVVRRIDE